MPNNQDPWIEIKQPQGNRYQQENPDIDRKYPWQAMFACHIGIRSYEERLKLKWGFSPAFLLEEALDRQKLFIESQLSTNPIDGHVEKRTLALRCIAVPNSGLRLGLVARILAESQEMARGSALNYWRELESIFPYDYSLCPASSADDFHQLSGRDILRKCNEPDSIAQVRRFEHPLRTSKGVFRMLGLWQTSLRSDEQIWRALANYPHEILLNISISPTIVFEGERRALLEMQQSAQVPQNSPVNEPYIQHFEAWIDPFIRRHTSPWNRYFYLQVHLASPVEIDEYIFRSVGSAITRENSEQPSPGFQVIHPTDKNDAINWCNNLDELEMIHSNRSLLLPRLSEMANLGEVQAVFRLPYPPEEGLPDTKFLST